jgi:pyrroline-5-carboxylate reductase
MIVGLMGCGNMGGALVRGWREAPELELRLLDQEPGRAAALLEGIARGKPVQAAEELLEADVIVLAVKPYGIVPALARFAAAGAGPEKLFVSIAAGVELQAMEKALPGGRIIRTMPNVGAALGAGTTAAVLGSRCAAGDADLVRAVFEPVGEVVIATSEAQMHGATGLAGSGPAFFLAFLEAMIDGGVAAGLSRADAAQYAAGALRAASRLADTGEAPAAIRARITSPGGTTIAGLNALEHASGRASMLAAVEAAVKRSKEMAHEA